MQLNGPIACRPTPAGGTFTWSRILIGYMAVSLVAGSSALAQAAKTPDFPTIRKTTLTGTDRNTVETWATQQVQQLFAADDDKTAQTRGQAFLKEILTNAKAADATAKFREGLAEILAGAFNKQYKTASTGRRPLATVYVLMSINQVAAPTPAVIDAFKLALTDATPGGRLMGATGLLSLRNQLSDEQWKTLLPDLQKAAADEVNGVVLDRLYRLLTTVQAPRVEAAIPVVLNVLETRLTRFDRKKGWPAQADGEAAKWLGEKLAASQNAQQQNRTTSVLARLLTDATYAYLVKPNDEWVESLEKTIIATESQLKKLVAARAAGIKLPSPDVTASMLEKGMQEDRDKQGEDMVAALHKWIGAPGKPGVLNAAPFSFEPGLKIAPPTTTTKPAADAA